MQPFSKRTVLMTAVLLIVTLLLTVLVVLPGQAATPDADGARIYDGIPSLYPGNFASQAFQATSTDEFGDYIMFAGTERQLGSVVVAMSNWACGNDFTFSSGNWVPKVGSAPCTTDATTGPGFDHPITLNIYAVDKSGSKPEVGPLLATTTQTFLIPFRPSADPAHCSVAPYNGTQWYSAADGKCYNGYAFNIEFDFAALNVTLPDEIVYGVAFNTYTHGAVPIGVNGPYSSLNVAVHAEPPTVGTDVEPLAMFVDSTWAGNYCDTSTTVLDIFRRDGDCWAPYHPAVRFNVQPAEITLTPSANMVCDADSVTIDFSGVNAMYGYEFVVEYDAAKVNATGSFINTWFNTSGAFIPWNGSCAAGVCKFAVSLQSPATAVSGSGPVAKIDLTDKVGGAFQLKIKDVVLSDIDGFTIPATVVDDTIDLDVCGRAAFAGRVSMQGRLTPMDAGTVKLIDPSATFPDITVPFNAAGNFSATNIPVLPAGSNYKIQALHGLYLTNEKTQLLAPGANLTGQNTRLLGGDANNSTVVEINDLSCIGGDFGLTPSTCGGTGSSDINLDAKVNIQDLSIAGGNYAEVAPQGW